MTISPYYQITDQIYVSNDNSISKQSSISTDYFELPDYTCLTGSGYRILYTESMLTLS